MKEINISEYQLVHGGIGPILARFTINSAITGGIGGTAVKATGGGLVGNAVWRPGFGAINAAGQAIAADD